MTRSYTRTRARKAVSNLTGAPLVTSPHPGRFDGHEYPQVLPPIDDIRPGPSAPWSSLPLSARTNLSLDHVIGQMRGRGRHRDSGPLPGVPDEVAALAAARGEPLTRRSAVLVALFEEVGETRVILTRRALHLRHHRGEVAFPGGRTDGDESPSDTALREAHEEVGIAPESAEVVGWLSPIATFASGSAIWPVVATLPGRPAYVIDPSEVDRAYDVALADLVHPDNHRTELWRRTTTRPGSDPEGYFAINLYRVPGDLVWGATARILTELLCVATGVAWPDEGKTWG